MSCVSEAKPCAICMARLGHVVSAHSRAQQLALDQSCTMCSACLEPTIRSQIFCIWDIQRQHHGAAFWTPQAKVQNICSSEHVLRGVLESCLQRRKSQCRSMGSRVSLDNSCLRVVATGASALLGSLPGALAAGTMCRLIPKHRPLICLYHPKRSDHKIFRETCRDCQWLILTSDHNTINSSEITSWLLYHSDMLCVAHETRSCAAVSSHVV